MHGQKVSARYRIDLSHLLRKTVCLSRASGTKTYLLIYYAECTEKCPASWWPPQSITNNQMRTHTKTHTHTHIRTYEHTNIINSTNETMRNDFRTPLFTFSNNKFLPNIFCCCCHVLFDVIWKVIIDQCECEILMFTDDKEF